MKKLVLIFTLLFAGCSDALITNQGVFQPYGLVDEPEIRNECITYHVSGWSIAAGIFFSETAIVPIYIVGWDLYEPIHADYDCLVEQNG